MTPRQAGKTLKGRKQVAEMVNDLEKMALRSPYPQF